MLRDGLKITLLLSFLTCCCFAESKDKTAALLIERAKQLSDIRAEGSPAFLLKTEYKIVRDPDHPVVGTYSETWLSRSLSRTEVTAGEFHRIEVVNNRKRWELSTAADGPKDISFAANSSAYGLRHLSVDSRGPDKIVDRASGSWSLRCILGHEDFGGRQELCFERSTGEYVASSAPFVASGGRISVSRCVFTNFQKFGEKTFPTLVQCFEGDKEVLETKVIELSFPKTIDNAIFAAIAGAKEFPNCPADVQHAVGIETPDPDRIAGGPVVLALLVDDDGRPYDLKIVTSAGPQMDNAALEAVRHWRFKPATCEGQPIESRINVVVTSHVAGQ